MEKLIHVALKFAQGKLTLIGSINKHIQRTNMQLLYILEGKPDPGSSGKKNRKEKKDKDKKKNKKEKKKEMEKEKERHKEEAHERRKQQIHVLQNEAGGREKSREEEGTDGQMEEEPVRRTEVRTEPMSVRAVNGGAEKLLNMKRNR